MSLFKGIPDLGSSETLQISWETRAGWPVSRALGFRSNGGSHACTVLPSTSTCTCEAPVPHTPHIAELELIRLISKRPKAGTLGRD